MAKPQRKCIFCEGANLSREHLWPQWSSEYLPQFPENSHQEKIYTFQHPTMPIVPPKHQKTNGRIWTKKIKVVCKTCNETWMSRIEEKAKPILLPLIKGAPCTITEADCLTLSKWSALKAMIAENNKNNAPTEIVTTQAQRTTFKDTQEIPKNLWVMIAKCGAPGFQTAYIRSTGTLGLDPASLDRTKNIHCITIGFGELLIQVIHTRLDELKLNYRNPPFITRIYPTVTELKWPVARALTKEEAFRFSMSLDDMFKQLSIRHIA